MGAESGNNVFRVGLRTRGCNGMAYTLDHAEIESKQKFEELVNQDGVSIIIDMKAQMTLLGTEMDYRFFIKINLKNKLIFFQVQANSRKASSSTIPTSRARAAVASRSIFNFSLILSPTLTPTPVLKLYVPIELIIPFFFILE